MNISNVVLVGILASACSSVFAETKPELVKELRERLDVVEVRWSSNDAAGIVQEVYVPETEITGEQTEPLFTGTEQLTELVASLVRDSKSAKVELDRVTPLGEDTLPIPG